MRITNFVWSCKMELVLQHFNIIMVVLAWSCKNLHVHAKATPIGFSSPTKFGSLEHFISSCEIATSSYFRPTQFALVVCIYLVSNLIHKPFEALDFWLIELQNQMRDYLKRSWEVRQNSPQSQGMCFVRFEFQIPC